jgi:hypothetical protein
MENLILYIYATWSILVDFIFLFNSDIIRSCIPASWYSPFHFISWAQTFVGIICFPCASHLRVVLSSERNLISIIRILSLRSTNYGIKNCLIFCSLLWRRISRFYYISLIIYFEGFALSTTAYDISKFPHT